MRHEATCATCGDTLEIEIDEDGNYDSHHYFGEGEFPTEDAEVVSEKEEVIEGLEDLGPISIVEYDEYDSFECWECEDCYAEIHWEGDDHDVEIQDEDDGS